jgi:signal transduction histidine kinase
MMIVAATAAALVGFVAAYTAFRRQQRLSELKSNFVSSVSHELRAPVASVRLMAESLERGVVPEAPRQQEYYRLITQECRRLSSLVDNVLDFSRIEQGRKDYEFEPTDVLRLVTQTKQLMEPVAVERGVSLKLELPSLSDAESLEPSLDGKAIQQALINLVDNAMKHSPKGEVVTIGLSVESTEPAGPPSWISLWVEDRGEGIPASEQERIFERFYRCGSELTRETQGVGIGLSIVKHVVEAHGGNVRVRSAPGQGSRFTLELPWQPLPP